MLLVDGFDGFGGFGRPGSCLHLAASGILIIPVDLGQLDVGFRLGRRLFAFPEGGPVGGADPIEVAKSAVGRPILARRTGIGREDALPDALDDGLHRCPEVNLHVA